MSRSEFTEEQKRIKEKFTDWVAGLPDFIAVPVLSELGRKRPELNVRYPELDRKIQVMLQTMLDELGYSHVTVQSVEKNAHSTPGYPYVFRFESLEEKWFLSYVFGALQEATRTTDIVLIWNPKERLAFVKLRPHRMHVVRERNAASMQD